MSVASTTQSVAALVAAFYPHPVRTADLEVAAAQLDIDASHVRVALSRLRAKGTIEVAARGLYRLAPEVALRRTALGPWPARLERLRPWDGAFWVALSGWLPKSDRKARRRREQALERLGFKEVHYGFALRPANLRLAKEELGALLIRLGFDERAELMEGRALSFDPRPLWTVPDYAGRAQALDRSRAELSSVEGAHAAVASFQFANEHVLCAVRDPLLPDGWVDSGARRAFWRALAEYDAFGRELWKTRVWEAAGISIDDVVASADAHLGSRIPEQDNEQKRAQAPAPMGGNR